MFTIFANKKQINEEANRGTPIGDNKTKDSN